MKKITFYQSMATSWAAAVALAVALSAGLPSCDKDEQIDPTQEKINALNAEINLLDNQVRAAFGLARTSPNDITVVFDNLFEFMAKELFGRKALNIEDSCNVVPPLVENLKGRGKYGNPENATILYNLALEDLAKRAERDSLTQQK
ncbi:MAG: hypothetical protein LBB79_03265 [Prevotellaceae bacterium]|jgi:hypothetical protein|nr:hypothetical protein [Prevotellaceae bacterium]